jgi:hypothetical protein
MTTDGKRQARGRILAIQEQVFRLHTEQGQNYLLTLGHGAHTRPEELRRFKEHGTLVEVEYEGEPSLASGKALAVREV